MSLFVAMIVVLTEFGWAASALAADPEPLRILLTNDDGYDAPGIKTVHEYLVTAGHDVTLVAPLTDHSSSGMRVTAWGSLNYEEQAPGVWTVDGFPADAVLVGLLHVMRDELPDLVISGANFGQNLGFANSSGTVGAATMAMYAGLPAVAISVGINPSEHSTDPVPYASTLAAFSGAAEFIVKLIDDLQRTRAEDGRLLAKQTILNVNYPAARPDAVNGVRVVKTTWDRGVRIDYEETERAGQLNVELKMVEPGDVSGDDADWQWFARGYVTISVLDGDSAAEKLMRDAVSRRLSVTGPQ
ncbi:MAG: 5'/3'-nucleotidase SurE [Woeseiaceae bacterium]